MTKLCAVFFLLIALLTGPSHAADGPDIQPVSVVASFSILADMIQQVGGPWVSVQSLAGPDQDAHSFQPTPQDAIKLKEAEIIAINGLKFEEWMHRLIKASGTKAKLLVSSAGVRPLLMPHEKGEIRPDPHAWQDLRNAKLYVKNIASALIEARPQAEAEIKQRASAYLKRCLDMDEQARAAFAELAQERRKLVTNHDAFGYFAEAYGVVFLSPAGTNSEADVSASGMAALIKQIKSEGIKTLFIENISDDRLIKQIADETGARLGGTLYADALSTPDGEAPTYLDMMKANIEKMLKAMR